MIIKQLFVKIWFEFRNFLLEVLLGLIYFVIFFRSKFSIMKVNSIEETTIPVRETDSLIHKKVQIHSDSASCSKRLYLHTFSNRIKHNLMKYLKENNALKKLNTGALLRSIFLLFAFTGQFTMLGRVGRIIPSHMYFMLLWITIPTTIVFAVSTMI